jgi:hypothetical protein
LFLIEVVEVVEDFVVEETKVVILKISEILLVSVVIELDVEIKVDCIVVIN